MKYIKLITAIIITLLVFTACKDDETIIPQVSITTFSPQTANIGDVITLNGQNIDVNDTYQVFFNGLEGTVTEVATTYLKVTVPERAASGEISVVFNGKTISAGSITIINIFTGDVQLLTQQEVEDFGANNYSAIVGRLLIGDDHNPTPASIVSLESLSALTSISSSLRIEHNTALTNVDGLNNITETGNLLLEYNDALTNVNGLSSLTTTLGFYIYYNPLLSTLEGLSSLTFVDYLYINGNASLTTLNGLQNLTTIDETLEINNTALTNIDALSNITMLTYNLEITNNAFLTSIEGLSNLVTIEEEVEISENELLTNLDGLIGLTSVGYGVDIRDNLALANLDGLTNLATVGDSFYIDDNPILSDFCGLNTLIIDNNYTDLSVRDCAYNPTEQDIIDGNCSQ